MSKIEKIRAFMQAHDVQGYIVPSTDPHLSEYVPKCWRRRAYISGFTGSYGDVALTLKEAGLWTDSRYFIQAEQQLEGTDITLFRQGVSGTPDTADWFADQLSAGDKIGIDPQLFSHKSCKKLKKRLSSHGIGITLISKNPVDAIWRDRPPFPTATAEVQPENLSGKSVNEKLTQLRDAMAESKVDACVLTTLDDIAWIFNIRGSDVPYTPVLIAYAIIDRDAAWLYVDPQKVTPHLEEHLLGAAGISHYDEFESAVRRLSNKGQKTLLDPETTSQWIIEQFGDVSRLELGRNPVTTFKAAKNQTEISGCQSAHVRDGVAMVKFLHWLEETVPSGNVTECSAADKLASFRAENDRFKGLSFNTISAFGAHGAIVHYEPDSASDIPLTEEGIYLIDSGGQYLDGTTDITRTIAIGRPTEEQKALFTRVLKGHIALASSRFPAGTSGSQLDTIARKPLWDIGLNYGHGTGHGVGAYLSVHEGPQSISYYRGIGIPLKEGMILSIEPGYYKEGAFGIRIENLVHVVKDDVYSKKDTDILTFLPLTLCPIDSKLVEPSLLSEDEITYLNAYHARVKGELSPHLLPHVAKWLARATAPVTP